MSLLQRLKNRFNTASGYQQRRLAAVAEIISALPEGKALLQLAFDLNCPITMENAPLFSGSLGQYSPGDFALPPAARGHSIWLDSNQNDKALAGSLLHELRHLWQMTTISNAPHIDMLSLGARMAFTRAVEGDAMVFQQMMLHKLRHNETPAPEKWAEAFDRFQKSGTASSYDLRTIKTRRREAEETGPAAEGRIKTLAGFNLQDIFRAGTDSSAPAYMEPTVSKKLKPSLMAQVKPFETDMARSYYRQLRRDKAANRRTG